MVDVIGWPSAATGERGPGSSWGRASRRGEYRQWNDFRYPGRMKWFGPHFTVPCSKRPGFWTSYGRSGSPSSVPDQVSDTPMLHRNSKN